MKISEENRGPARIIPGVVVAGLTLLLLAALFRHFAVTLPFPYPIEYGEGVMVNWAQRLRRGMQLYPSMAETDIPWLHNPYGPLWFWVAAPLSGFSEGSFTAGRMISLAGYVFSLACLYRLCRYDLSRVGAACVTMLFAATPLTWRYAAMARVDMTALAASLASLVLIEKGMHRERGCSFGDNSVSGEAFPAYWFLAGVASSLAILFKPIFVAAALTGLVACAGRRRSRAVAFALGLGLPILATAVWVAATGQEALPDHFGAMNRIGFSLTHMVRIILMGAMRHPFAFFALLFGLFAVKQKTARWWFALFTTLLLISTAKIGADAHYFIGPLAAGVIMAAPLSARALRGEHAPILIWCLAAQLALYLPVAPRPVFTATYGQEVPAYHSALTPGKSDEVIGRALSGEIAVADGPVLADDPGYVLSAGREITIQPFQYGKLVRAGRIDGDILARHIADGYFALIILRQAGPEGPGGSDFPPQVIAAAKKYGRLHREIGPYVLYVP